MSANDDDLFDELERRRRMRDAANKEKQSEPPETQTESRRAGSGRDRSGRPPRGRKIAVGSYDDGRRPYRAGDNVICTVTGREPGGYSVVIVKDNVPGFLPTQAMLKIGDEILAQYVCEHNQRILLSARFSAQTGKAQPSHGHVNWEKELGQPGCDPSRQMPADQESEDFSAADETQHQRCSFKRATDLMLPPLEPDSVKEFRIADYDLGWLITDLEGGMRTCCVKASCEERLSRSAMLLYRGRVVGCVYGCRSMPVTQPTEQSLRAMLSDLEVASTLVQVYDLPENVTLAMSALFLGYPVQRNDNYDARSYMDYICSWFEARGQTACLAITIPSNAANCLGFVYKGQFCGSFYIEDQKLQTDREYVYDLLRRDPKANVEASLLPPEMLSPSVRFGFSLSLFRREGPP